jgi:hypothetical protein
LALREEVKGRDKREKDKSRGIERDEETVLTSTNEVRRADLSRLLLLQRKNGSMTLLQRRVECQQIKSH